MGTDQGLRIQVRTEGEQGWGRQGRGDVMASQSIGITTMLPRKRREVRSRAYESGETLVGCDRLSVVCAVQHHVMPS